MRRSLPASNAGMHGGRHRGTARTNYGARMIAFGRAAGLLSPRRPLVAIAERWVAVMARSLAMGTLCVSGAAGRPTVTVDGFLVAR